MTAPSGWNTNGTTLNVSTRMTAGASLKPDSGLQQPGQAAGQRQHPQHREHRGRIGGGDDRAEQQGELPVHAQQQVCTGGGDRGADHNTEGGQRRLRVPVPPGYRRTGWSNRLRQERSPVRWYTRCGPTRHCRTPARSHRRPAPCRPAGRTAGWGTRSGSPTRVPMMLASRTTPPVSKVRYSWFRRHRGLVNQGEGP